MLVSIADLTKNIEAEFETQVSDSVGLIADAMDQGLVPLYSYSGGKDSSVTLNLGIDAALARKQAGLPVPPIYVLHSDTLIENPIIHKHVMGQLQEIHQFGEQVGLDIRVRVVTPNLLDTWQVSIIGGSDIPTFPHIRQRRCTVDMKSSPLDKAFSQIVREIQEGGGMPVSITGTRSEESVARAANMAKRGEGAWLRPLIRGGKKIRVEGSKEYRRVGGKQVGYQLSPIADWNENDVWHYLSRAGSDTGKTWPGYVPNFEATRSVYADAMGECPVTLGDAASQGGSGCGSRFGCATCCAVKEDKSMRNMLGVYPMLRGINQIQRWVMNSRYDYSLRRPIYRNPDPTTGWLRVAPNNYDAPTTEHLLRMMLTVDKNEQVRAQAVLMDIEEGLLDDTPENRALADPMFQLITDEMLIGIDALWSREALHRPFHALKIYKEIYFEGRDYFPRPGPEVQDQGMPEAFWIDLPEEVKLDGGFRDSVYEAFTEGCRQYGVRERVTVSREIAEDGEEKAARQMSGDFERYLQVELAESFSVDPEGAGLVLDLELDRLIEIHDNWNDHSSWTYGVMHYLQLGTVAISAGNRQMFETMIDRTRLWETEGLRAGVSRETLLNNKGHITDKAHKELVKDCQNLAEESRQALAFARKEAAAWAVNHPDEARALAVKEAAGQIQADLPYAIKQFLGADSVIRSQSEPQEEYYRQGVPQKAQRAAGRRVMRSCAKLVDEYPEVAAVMQEVKDRVYGQALWYLDRIEADPNHDFTFGFGGCLVAYDLDAQRRAYLKEMSHESQVACLGEEERRADRDILVEGNLTLNL